MRKSIILLVLAFVFSNSFAQEAPDSTWAESSPVIDYAREVVKSLCSPKMNGRGVAAGGEQAAADYILTEFRSIGVMPLGKDYFQNFPVSANSFPARMSLLFDKDKASLKAGEDFWVDPTCPSIEGIFNLVYITRRQLNDPMVRMDKLRDAKDGFILIDNDNKFDETPEMAKKLNGIIEKIKTDMEVQLRGVMIYDRSKKLSWSSSPFQSSRAVIYLAKELDVRSLRSVNVQIDAEYKSAYETQNVVGVVEGSTSPDSAIIITAHYDHLGLMGKDVYFPGANGNATGVAMLLSLAKHFEMIHSKYRIIFIALGAEELGFEGSKAYANNPAIPLSKVKFVLNFDVLGTGVDGTKVVNGTLLESKFKLLSDINKRDKYIPNLSPRAELCFSGHCEFHKKNVPCFWIYTVGGNFRNLNDTPDNTPLTSFENLYNLSIKFIERIK